MSMRKTTRPTPGDVGRYVASLMEHTAAFRMRLSETKGKEDEGPISAAELMQMEFPPLGREWCDDPELAFRYLSIREIGWELFAIGGTDLMREVNDRVYEIDALCGVRSDRLWEEIGVGADRWRA